MYVCSHDHFGTRSGAYLHGTNNLGQKILFFLTLKKLCKCI